jgi:hypothetical protein
MVKCENIITDANMSSSNTAERVPIIPVIYKGYTIKADAISSIAELTIEGKINDRLTPILLDSGSDGNLISRNTLEQILPHWQELEDAPGPNYAECAGNNSIKMIANKWLRLELGGIQKEIPFSVVPEGEVTILGVGGLKYFNFSLHFGHKGVEIYTTETNIYSQEARELIMFSTNQERITLRPRESKLFVIENVNLIENEDYIVAVHRGPAVLIPGLATARKHKLVVLLHNDQRTKLSIKRNTLVFRIKRFH